MVEVCALASGSNGNCYYIGNESDAVLVDAGISTKQILLRIEKAGLDAKKIRAVFVTHEHVDHVRGVRVLSKRLGIPVWFTVKTFDSVKFEDRPEKVNFFIPDQLFYVGSFTIFPFLKNHDASEPCSFRVVHDGWNVGVFTDIGKPCERVIGHLKKCHAIFLESNYDEQMLWNGSYPFLLKKRVGSDNGHLSNDQAFELLQKYAGPELVHVFLSHLSGENNKPEIAINRFKSLISRFNVSVASRHDHSEVCCLR